MVHKPFLDWMNEQLDGALDTPTRRQLDEHLTDCGECRVAWAALADVDRRFKVEPMLAARAGFAGRFNARRGQQRSRPRMLWGAAGLGLGAVASAALVLPLGLGLAISLARAVQQPATLLALSASANASAEFARTTVEALYIAGRALLAGLLSQPLAWAGALLALLLTVVWLYVMRRLVPEGTVP